jgi:hypothetical protein
MTTLDNGNLAKTSKNTHKVFYDDTIKQQLADASTMLTCKPTKTTLDNGNLAKTSKSFCCELCDYTTQRKSNMTAHKLTAKHTKTTMNQQNKQKISKTYSCENCNKIHNDRAGLWRHKKVCLSNNSSNNSSNNNDIDIELNNDKDELIQYLISENKDFKTLILEVCKNVQGINNINNMNNNNNNVTHTNSHNKSFNLQFFLNETCKDAMNMSEFIESMKLQLSDLESVGKLGFVDGISNIIIKNLEALDVEKRPVHCSDSKRETMYIKEHDKWEKDDTEMKQMKELVRTVRDRNILLVATWRDLYPECVKSNSKKTAQFNQICMEAFGGETGGDNGTKQEKEDKIISRIAKSVVIDKS